MKKFALALIAGLVFGLVPIVKAAQLPDFMHDLNRWMGRDNSYYENRWDPNAERFLRFEDRFRHRVDAMYQDGEISRGEYRHFRNELIGFDDQLRHALSEGSLSERDQRFLENRQDRLREDLREARSNRGGSRYYGTNPDYRDYDRD